jgi:hypothetical protein
MSDLFEQVIESSGLSPLFARNALRRACSRAGVEADILTPAALRSALPEIERTIQTYMDSRTSSVMERISALARQR